MTIERYYSPKQKNGPDLPLGWHEVSRHTRLVDAKAQLERFKAQGIPAKHLRITES